MSTRAIGPVWPTAIWPMRVNLFPSGMLCVTNIPSIKDKNTLCCLELNGEYAGESFMLLNLKVLRYTHVKLKNCRFSKKLTFDLS